MLDGLVILIVGTEICITLPMKITLNLNDELVASAKAMAAQHHSTLTRLIERGLRLRLAAGNSSGLQAGAYVPKLPVFVAKAVCAAVSTPRATGLCLKRLNPELRRMTCRTMLDRGCLGAGCLKFTYRPTPVGTGDQLHQTINFCPNKRLTRVF